MAAWSVADIPDQRGRFALVTGATDGLGLETALALAGAGAEVLLTGRNAVKGEAALRMIRTHHPDAVVRFALADLANLASIRAFAEDFVAQGRPLDLLVNNAGIAGLVRRQVTADGFEMQFGVNYLGHFALTALLMPALLRAVSPLVVTVASLTHRRARLDFANLQTARGYNPPKAYGRSKLANLIFALELDRRCRAAGSRLRSVAAHPGLAVTSLVPGIGSAVFRLMGKVLGQSAAQGALPILYAATMPVEGGAYIGPSRRDEMVGPPGPARIFPHAQDAGTAARLWAESERLTGVTFPAVA